jgi:hypothetical protein
MPLTDSMARNAKPAAKTVRMFDRDGLYLEVSPPSPPDAPNAIQPAICAAPSPR